MRAFGLAICALLLSGSAMAASCGAPLADNMYCYVENNFVQKAIRFESSCRFYFGEASHGESNSFSGTWSLEGNFLTLQSEAGSGTRELVFSDDGRAFWSPGYEHEVYRLCTGH